jgi:RNA-directed DNA polymerase
MDANKLFPTDEGTPEGGVISPLLANIALHGLEDRLKQFASSLPGRKKENISALTIVRYADDFVVLHPSLHVITQSKQIVAEWLNGMGLEMSEKKTRITHTLMQVENQQPGFNFLGFNIRQYPVGQTHTGRVQGKLLGFKTLIKPSEKKIQLHVREIGEIISAHKTASQEALIAHLNPVIVGWSNYYSTLVSKETFNTCDNHLYSQLKAWAERRHPNKNSSWIADKYWQTVGERNWAFGASSGEEIFLLAEHKKTPIIRHIKVKGLFSPFNGDWAYWSARRGTHPQTSTRVSRLMKIQKGKCPHCNLYIRSEDLIEVDHIIPRSQNGKDNYSNIQLLHRHCHDTKTTMDIKSPVGSTHIKGQNTEEPDDAKVSRPVLKTSGSREGIA